MTSRDLSAAERLGQLERHYRAYRGKVYRWSLRYAAGRREWAEDLTHDVFVRLQAHLEHLDDERELAPWLYRTTANCALNRLRDERSVLGKLSRLFSGEPADVPGPEAKLGRRQAALQVLRELPPLERVVLCMKVLDGKSQQEVAHVLSMSEGYVSKLSTRGWERVEKSGWEVGDEA